MTQRIFDIENEKDYADLWDIISEEVFKITKQTYNDNHDLLWYNNEETSWLPFNINWHDKTEITRPIQEATEQDIGKLCIFWDYETSDKHYGLLTKIKGKYYQLENASQFNHCRRLTKQEIEELC